MTGLSAPSEGLQMIQAWEARLTRHSEGPWQAREMGQQEPCEAQQREMQIPAPKEE